MNKLIKTLFELAFVYNNKYYILICTRDLIEKSGLTGNTIRSDIKKLLDEQILIDTGFIIPSSAGPEDYHASKGNLYRFNISNIKLEDRFAIPAVTWNIENFLKKESRINYSPFSVCNLTITCGVHKLM